MKIKNQTWLNGLQSRRGKEISKLFFESYKTADQVSKEFKPQSPNPQKIVFDYFKLWKEYGFLDKSKPLRELTRYQLYFIPKELLENARYLPKNFALHILNFEPIYRYCKEKKIRFAKEERSYLNNLLLNDNYRKAILKESSDDIVHATLMFYARNCIIRYQMLAADIIENKKKYQSDFDYRAKIPKVLREGAKKALEELDREMNLPSEAIDYPELWEVILRITLKHKDKETVKDKLFVEYIIQKEYRKSLVASVDRKILKALNLLPSI